MSNGVIVLLIDEGMADGPDPLGQELPSDYETCGECGYDHEYECKEAYAYHSKLPTPLSDSGGFMKAKDVVIGSKVYTYIGTDLCAVVVVAQVTNYNGKTVFQVKREGSDTILPKTRTAAALRLKNEKYLGILP